MRACAYSCTEETEEIGDGCCCSYQIFISRFEYIFWLIEPENPTGYKGEGMCLLLRCKAEELQPVVICLGLKHLKVFMISYGITKQVASTLQKLLKFNCNDHLCCV